MPSSGPASVEYVRSALEQVRQKFTAREKRIMEARKRRRRWRGYEAEHENIVPEKFRTLTKPHRSSLIQDTARRGQAMLSSSLPEPVVPALNPEDVEEQNRSGRLEAGLRALYAAMDRHDHTWGKITDSLVVDGEAVWRCVPVTERWVVDAYEDETDEHYLRRLETVKRDNIPFDMEHVDTLAYLPVAEDKTGYLEVIEWSRREALPVMSKYGLTAVMTGGGKVELRAVGNVVSPADISPSATVPHDCEFIEWWNTTNYMYIVDGEVVEEGEHGLGEVPYYHANFSISSDKTPGYETEGLLDVIIPLQDDIEEVVTAQKNWSFIGAYPAIDVAPMGEFSTLPGTEELTIEYEPGGPMVVEGHKVGWVAAPSAGADLNILREHFMREVDKLSLAPILYGQMTGQMSGPASLQLVGLAHLLFGTAIASLQSQMDKMAGMMLRAIEQKIKQPVPVEKFDTKKQRVVGWLQIDPADIDGYYVVRHQFNPLSHLEKQANMVMAADYQARGLISARKAREMSPDITDPAQMDREVTVETMMKDPRSWEKLFAMAELLINPPAVEDEIRAFTEAVMGNAGLGPESAGMGAQGGVSNVPAPEPPVGPAGPGVMQTAGVQQMMQPGTIDQMAAQGQGAGAVPAGQPAAPAGQPTGPG